MTLHKPTLIVNRLNVYKSGQKVVDLQFRKGFNVVYGENSTGKSSVLEFLFFGLGGDFPRWQPAARSCEEVVCEVLLNGDLVTLRREIVQNANAHPSMDIYWGPIEEALEKANAFWERYPYIRSSKESFTQILFDNLGMPAVPTKEGSNVTMHQILRLVYSDQMTSADEIFRSDRFDKHLTKEMVGELICGVYDAELHEFELTKSNLEKELSEVNGSLRSLLTAVGHVKESFSLTAIENQVSKVKNEQNSLSDELRHLSRGEGDNKTLKSDQNKELNQLKKKLLKENDKLSNLTERSQFLTLDIEDSALFVQSLEENYAALMDSDITAKAFGTIQFSYCPSCLAPLKEHKTDSECGLCGSPRDKSAIARQRLRLKRDLEMQLTESSEIHKQRVVELEKVDDEIRSLRSQINAEKRKYAKISNPVAPPEQIQIQKIYERLGYLQREEEELNSRLEMGKKINALSKRKKELSGELSSLVDNIAMIEAAREERKAKAFEKISSTCIDILHKDLKRQKKFNEAKFVDFNFSKARECITVDGETKFSASSMVYLKNAFLCSLLFASMEDPDFCFPRLLFLDGIEDKGMEVGRVHHLQKIIEEYSSSSSIDHQIIITAEKLAEEFIDTKYIVGGTRYSPDNKSIKLVGFE